MHAKVTSALSVRTLNTHHKHPKPESLERRTIEASAGALLWERITCGGWREFVVLLDFCYGAFFAVVSKVTN